MKTLEELRKLDPKKLSEELQILEKQHFTTQFEVRNGQAKNSHDLKKHRRQMARIKTLIKHHEN